MIRFILIVSFLFFGSQALASSIGTVTNWDYLIPVDDWSGANGEALLKYARGACKPIRNGKRLSAASGPLSHVTVDMYSSNTALNKRLSRQGTQLMCYANFGGLEDWRPQAAEWTQKFSRAGVLGPCIKKLGGGCWPGEKWLKPSSDPDKLEVLREYVKSRLRIAKSKTCPIVELDNLDGYGHGVADQKAWVSYVKMIAQECRAAGITCGFKNAIEIAPRVARDFEFVTTERCNQFKRGDGSSECAGFSEIFGGKPILNIEYEERSTLPSSPNRLHLSRGEDDMQDALPALLRACRPGVTSTSREPQSHRSSR